MRRLAIILALLVLAKLLWRVARWALPWDPEIQPEPDDDDGWRSGDGWRYAADATSPFTRAMWESLEREANS